MVSFNPQASVEWLDHKGSVAPFIRSSSGKLRPVAWAGMPGSQQMVLRCPIFELLYEGTRGPGKSETMLMDYAQNVGLGFSHAHHGVIFRRTYKQLGDLVIKSQRLFPKIFANCRFLSSASQFKWVWETGEELLFRVFKNENSYDDYHGHEFSFMGWDELTRWASDVGYKRMLSLVRTSHPGVEQSDGSMLKVPLKFRATTNPYGVGHGWVKNRFKLPNYRGRIIRGGIDKETGIREPDRVAIFGHLSENLILMKTDPEYQSRVTASARNSSERKAWVFGNWDVNAGGMFDDLWNSSVHIIPDFTIPAEWRIDRCFDWGSSKPFSVLMVAESNGDPVRLSDGRVMSTIPGDLFVVREWYGCRQGSPNEGLRMTSTDIGKGIAQREKLWFPGRQVQAGPADSSIFDDVDGNSIAVNMKASGITWTKSNKGPGSRVQGWQKLRELFTGSMPSEPGHPREEKGLFVCESCPEFIRTVPNLPRDDKNLDDADTESEDHTPDAIRYRCYQKRGEMGRTVLSGA